jgi:phage baseplate assembly protein W
VKLALPQKLDNWEPRLIIESKTMRADMQRSVYWAVIVALPTRRLPELLRLLAVCTSEAGE